MESQPLARSTLGELIRYGVIGIFSNSLGYCIYLLATHMGTTPKLTMTVLYVTAATIGFVGNRHWTFKQSSDTEYLKPVFKYFCTHLGAYLINLILLYSLVDLLGYPHQLIQGLAAIFIGGLLFLTFKYYIFPFEKTIFNTSDSLKK